MKNLYKNLSTAILVCASIFWCQNMQAQGDNCASATTIACGGSVSGSTVGATNNNGEVPAGTCGTSNGSGGQEWFVFTGTGDNITASLCGSGFDTKINVYRGVCGSLICVGGNDDNFAVCGAGNNSHFVFPSTAGTTYYIRVGGFLAAEGTYNLNLTCSPPPCASALPICCGQTVTGSTIGLPSESQPTCGTTSGTGGAQYYRFTSSSTPGSVTATLCNPGTDFDTKLRVWSGSCGSFTCVGGNDDSSNPGCQIGTLNRKSEFTFVTTANTTYFILVHGFGSAQGSYELSLNAAPGVCRSVAISSCDDVGPVSADANCEGSFTESITVTPTANCGPLLVSASGGGATYTATDAGGGNWDISSSDMPFGTTTVTVTASNGNADALCTFNVNVVDDSPPTVNTCPPTIVKEMGQLALWDEPSFMDNCDGLSLSGSRTDATGIVNGSTVLNTIGTFTISYAFSDDAGNGPAICSFDIEVVERSIPTMSEWGLILFGLIIFTLSVVFGTQMQRRMSMSTAMGPVSAPVRFGMPFNRGLFFRILPFVYLTISLIFAVAIMLFGYELTSADIPGSLMAGPIVAYLIHFVMSSSNKEGGK